MLRSPLSKRSSKRSVMQPHLAEVNTEVEDMRRFRVPPSSAGPKKVFLNCHYCGYAPPHELPDGGVCPKCGGSSWERFALSTYLLPEHMR